LKSSDLLTIFLKKECFEMKRHRNLCFIVMFAVLLFATSWPAAHGQFSQQTDDQDQSTGGAEKKKTSPSSSASTSPDSGSSTNNPSAAPQTPAGAPVGNAPAPKPDTAQRTQPAKGSGMVWVNTDSGVYHKPGTRWYGKTRKGKYMTEADAIKAGYRAAVKK
jgi:cytoskeletal protein RodZ